MCGVFSGKLDVVNLIFKPIKFILKIEVFIFYFIKYKCNTIL